MRFQTAAKGFFFAALGFLLGSPNAWGQIPNHTFPRTAIWQWAGSMPEWFAKFDLAMTRIDDPGFISAVRSQNPNIIWLPTHDFNTAYDFIPDFPQDWYVLDSRGRKFDIGYGARGTADMSDLCPRVNGQRLIDYYPQYIKQLVGNAGADGMATDGLYSRAHLEWRNFDDIDLDRNGVNDLQEHGKDWVLRHWAAGVEEFVQNIRNALGPDKIFIINSGSGDTPGLGVANGYVHEYGGNITDWDYERNYWLNRIAASAKPPIFLQQSNPDERDPNFFRPSKNYLSFMRFSLVKAMLFGRYYTFEHVDGKSADHFWNNYFDEFDLDLGHPTGPMQQVKSGIWVRFFDKGVGITNLGGSDQTISDQDLQAASGYNGPYYRFLGGQDLALNGANAMNNGQRFTSVRLYGYAYTGYNDSRYITGDGVILVRTPQTVVSEIVIDNAEPGTSPGSDVAQLHNGFSQLEGCRPGGSYYYSLRCYGSYPYAVGAPGNATAVFAPNIGAAGNYEVYEWHGSLPGSQASNVRYIVKFANGSTTKTVDQRQNYGKWNYLGTFRFAAGKSGNVTISTAGANGAVMADAIKFVYTESDVARDTDPPAAPQSVEVKLKK